MLPPELAWIEPVSRLGTVSLLFLFIGALYIGRLRWAREIDALEKERTREREAADKAYKDNDSQWQRLYTNTDALWRERFLEKCDELEVAKKEGAKPLELLDRGIRQLETLTALMEKDAKPSRRKTS